VTCEKGALDRRSGRQLAICDAPTNGRNPSPFGGTHPPPCAAEGRYRALDPTGIFTPGSLRHRHALIGTSLSNGAQADRGWFPRFWSWERARARVSGVASSVRRVGIDRARPPGSCAHAALVAAPRLTPLRSQAGVKHRPRAACGPPDNAPYRLVRRAPSLCTSFIHHRPTQLPPLPACPTAEAGRRSPSDPFIGCGIAEIVRRSITEPRPHPTSLLRQPGRPPPPSRRLPAHLSGRG